RLRGEWPGEPDPHLGGPGAAPLLAAAAGRPGQADVNRAPPHPGTAAMPPQKADVPLAGPTQDTLTQRGVLGWTSQGLEAMVSAGVRETPLFFSSHASTLRLQLTDGCGRRRAQAKPKAMEFGNPRSKWPAGGGVARPFHAAASPGSSPSPHAEKPD